ADHQPQHQQRPPARRPLVAGHGPHGGGAHDPTACNGTGTSPVTTVPPPGPAGSTQSRPPSAPTRSDMFDSPWPGTTAASPGPGPSSSTVNRTRPTASSTCTRTGAA